MPKYKVSYKVLSQSATDIKAVAKMYEDYATKVKQIQGKLGDDQLLAQVRQNLQKLSTQLGESQQKMAKAGDVLAKSVEKYTKSETNVVKRVDDCKCHQRDFYKRPVAVASPGAAGAAPTSTTTTVNYTETNTVNISAAAPAAAPVNIPVATPMSVEPAAAVAAAAGSGIGGAVAAGVGGVVVGAAAAVGAKALIDKGKSKEDPKSPAEAGDEKLAALEAELKAARERAAQG